MTSNIERLVLCEGWPIPDPSVWALPPDLEARMNALLAEGDRDAVVELLFRELEDSVHWTVMAKIERLDLRLTPEDDDVIRRAARAEGLSVSAFVTLNTLSMLLARLAVDAYAQGDGIGRHLLRSGRDAAHPAGC